jgi:hypothetical protein
MDVFRSVPEPLQRDVLPWLADKAPSLVDAINQGAGLIIAFIAGLVVVLTGTVLLAIPFIRGVAQPRWVGYVLVASALMTVIGDFIIAPNGPATNLAVNLLSNLGPVLLMNCARLSGLPDVVGVMPQSGNAGRGVIPHPPEDRISLGVLRRPFRALRPNPDWSWGGQVRLRSGA